MTTNIIQFTFINCLCHGFSNPSRWNIIRFLLFPLNVHPGNPFHWLDMAFWSWDISESKICDKNFGTKKNNWKPKLFFDNFLWAQKVSALLNIQIENAKLNSTCNQNLRECPFCSHCTMMAFFPQWTDSVKTSECAKPVTPVAWVLPCGRADGDSFLYYPQSHRLNTATTHSSFHFVGSRSVTKWHVSG